eukprot:6248118-Pyramimonas_sp.AAC.1
MPPQRMSSVSPACAADVATIEEDEHRLTYPHPDWAMVSQPHWTTLLGRNVPREPRRGRHVQYDLGSRIHRPLLDGMGPR